MDQFGYQLEIILDIFHFDGIMTQFRRQGFQCNFDSGRFVKTLIHHTHTTLTEFRKDFIPGHDQIADLESAIRFAVARTGHRGIIGHMLLFM